MLNKFKNYIKKIFNSEEDFSEKKLDELYEYGRKNGNVHNKLLRDCSTCKNKNFCTKKGKFLNNIESEIYCDFLKTIQYDKNKESIIIIDDNYGISSIIEDIVKKEKEIAKTHNILVFAGDNAAFEFHSFIKNNPEIKISHLFLDLTFPKVFVIENVNINLNGIDLLVFIKNFTKNKRFNLLIHTGNTLTSNSKNILEIKKNFEKISKNKEIEDYIIRKFEKDSKTREKIFLNFLHNKDFNFEFVDDGVKGKIDE